MPCTWRDSWTKPATGSYGASALIPKSTDDAVLLAAGQKYTGTGTAATETASGV